MAAIFTLGKILACIIGFVLAAAPSAIGLYKAIKAYKLAKSNAEKEAAKNAMLQYLNTCVTESERLYASVNDVLKAKGGSAGIVKKDSAMAKLQAFAIKNDYDFDAEFWSAKIDEIIDLTKSVNSK